MIGACIFGVVEGNWEPRKKERMTETHRLQELNEQSSEEILIIICPPVGQVYSS